MLPSLIVAAPALRMPGALPSPASPPVETSELADLLRQQNQLLAEQSALLRQMIQFQDTGPRWKAFLAKWQDDFPDIGGDCKASVSAIERTYLSLVKEVNDRLRETDANDLANDFALGEFLDRYSTRMAQLSGMLHQLNPLADHAPPLPALE